MEASALDLALTEDQGLIAKTVQEFARDVVQPGHEAWDHRGEHPKELWDGLAELGLFGVLVPEELGGAGAGMTAHVVVVETLARAAGLAGALMATQGLVVDAVVASENEAAIQSLEGLISGDSPAAPALQEDDLRFLQCTGVRDGDFVRLTGQKVNVPFLGCAGHYLVSCAVDGEKSLAWVAAASPGLVHRNAGATLGLSGIVSGSLSLEGVAGTLLGGASFLDRVWSSARIGVAALLSGICRGALDHAVRYAGERKQFKQVLRNFPALQERLVFSDAQSEASRGLVHGAASLRDRGVAYAFAARRARIFAGMVAPEITDHCVQVLGGYGYSREYPTERFYRDACFPGFGELHAKDVLRDSMAALA